MKNKTFILIINSIIFLLYVLMLWYRPTVSWCDETCFVDWAREMALYGNFHSKAWDVPSYMPLYPLMLAGWIKLVGFSYFKVHLFDIIILFINLSLILTILSKHKFIKKKWSLLGVAILLTFGKTIFWIHNCGRPETLSLLLLTISTYYFFLSYFHATKSNFVPFCLSSMLLLSASVQGYVAMLFMVMIVLLLNIGELKRHIGVVCCIVGSGFFSIVLSSVLFYMNGALIAFLRQTFLYSRTSRLLCRLFNAYVLHKEKALETTSTETTAQSFFERVKEMCANYEYCIVAIALIIIVFYLRKKLDLRENTIIRVFIRSFIAFSLVLPLLFQFAGRYQMYYTGYAYYPCVISFFILLEKIKIKYAAQMIITLWIFCFLVFPHHRLNSIDIYGNTNQEILTDIKKSGIDFDKPVVIPTEWYYYLVDSYNPQLYYQTSRRYPADLKYIVESERDDYISVRLKENIKNTLLKSERGVSVYSVIEVGEEMTR